jgi:hypothetical protein
MNHVNTQFGQHLISISFLELYRDEKPHFRASTLAMKSYPTLTAVMLTNTVFFEH